MTNQIFAVDLKPGDIIITEDKKLYQVLKLGGINKTVEIFTLEGQTLYFPAFQQIEIFSSDAIPRQLSSININQKVRVKINRPGLKILRNLPTTSLFETALEIGFLDLPLWQIMNIFGESMSAPTLQPPIEPDIQVLD